MEQNQSEGLDVFKRIRQTWKYRQMDTYLKYEDIIREAYERLEEPPPYSVFRSVVLFQWKEARANVTSETGVATIRFKGVMKIEPMAVFANAFLKRIEEAFDEEKLSFNHFKRLAFKPYMLIKKHIYDRYRKGLTERIPRNGIYNIDRWKGICETERQDRRGSLDGEQPAAESFQGGE